MPERITMPMDVQPGDYFAPEAVRSMIGQETTLRMGSQTYPAKIVDASGEGRGVSVTLEYDGPPLAGDPPPFTYAYSLAEHPRCMFCPPEDS